MLFHPLVYRVASPGLAAPRQFLHLTSAFMLVACLSLCLSACRETGAGPGTGSGSIPPGSEINDAQIVAVQKEHRMKTEITGQVRVFKVLAEDDEGLRHERFLVRLSNGTTVLVAHSIDKAEPVPVEVGDTIVLHGEYIFNEQGGVIHWTHHSDSPKHEGGWILYRGKRYQ